MESKKELETLEDVQLLVDSFYARVREDDLLKDIFQGVIQDRWPEHLDKMYRFWQTVLLEEHTYYGRPFPPHAFLPVDQAHFDRWLQLFFQTLTEHFEGEKAREAMWRAEKMAVMFMAKKTYLNDRQIRPLL